MTTAREETARLSDLLRREHHALGDFLVALAAFDRERRWVELGYNSLFSFLTRELGLSKGAAFFRNRAAELIQKFPLVLEPIRDGRICLTTVAELSRVVTAENFDEVLPRFFHLSKSEAKEVRAELQPDPAPPVRTVVTAVPVACAAPAPRPSASSAEVITPSSGFLENLLDANSAVPVGVRTPAAGPAPAQIEPLTAELRRLHVTVSRRLLDKLATARDALSHSHPGASEETILEVGLDLIIERHRKRRGIGAKPRAKAAKKEAAVGPTPLPASTAGRSRTADPTQPPPPTGRSRYVSAEVWRGVWERDQGRCVWPLAGGGICASTYRLELDHIWGWALGAGTTIDECRLLCRHHQDVHARALYGDDLMNRFTRPKGGTCSEPVAVWVSPSLSPREPWASGGPLPLRAGGRGTRDRGSTVPVRTVVPRSGSRPKARVLGARSSSPPAGPRAPARGARGRRPRSAGG